MKVRYLAAVALVCSALLNAAAWAGTKLITEEEAGRPPPKRAMDHRGITRGPKVVLISPSDNSRSPVHLRIKFESYGGAKIDPETVKMIFLRTPSIDLTPRVKPYVQPAGIDMPDTELPPGEHLLRVDLKDSEGRPGSTSFVLTILP